MRKRVLAVFLTICAVLTMVFVSQALLTKNTSAAVARQCSAGWCLTFTDYTDGHIKYYKCSDENCTTKTECLDSECTQLGESNKPDTIIVKERTIDITIPEESVVNGSTTATAGNFDCDQQIKEHTEKGKIGAMQWILCPSLNNTAYTANWMDNMVTKWLGVDNSYYNGNSDAARVWGSIRNIANIAMTVFLLIIIFSQITGYGIDNYGIKKMLPRLIMMAIIVNLSLYICQIAVDLSNIAGVGLRDLFATVGGAADSGTNFVTDGLAGLFGAAAVSSGAAVGAATTAATLGVYIVIAVVVVALVVALVIFVAVMILFIMLGLRNILLIACIILSPLAFAAFILPNTQNLFKKWWSLFKTVLLIFPICGATMGISAMLKHISDSGSESTMVNFGASVVLLILPYVIFFFLPQLLKEALSALGKLGGALTNMGSSVRRGGRAIGGAAMRAAQNSDRWKRAQADATMRREERNANRALQRVKRLKRRGRTPSDGDNMRALEATNKLNEIRQQRELAKLGGTELDDATIQSRALAIKEAQGLKNYSDQFANLTRPEMGTILADSVKDYGDARDEYNKAEMAYNSDKSDANKRAKETLRRILDNNALKLQAAIIASEGKNMNKEVADVLGGFKFDSSNATDAKILSRLAASSDKIISQYGIQMSKIGGDYETNDLDANGAIQYNPDGSVKTRKLTEAERNISLNDFIGSQAEVKLSTVSEGKGPSWLTTVNDDTLDAILKVAGGNPNALKALDTHSLLTIANTTTDGKVVTKVNQIFQARKDANISENYSMGTAELAKLKSSTADMLEGTGVYDKAVADIKADPNSAANKQILNAMEQDVKVKLGLDDASLAQTRGMQAGYATKTASDVYDEAVAENNRMNAQKQQEAAQAAAQQQAEMNNLHGQALEENKEWDRRQADIQQREAQTKALNRLADTMERFTGNNPGGQGPAPTFQPPAVVNNNPTFQPPAVVRNNPAPQPPAPRPNRGPNNGPDRRA